MRYLGIDYGEKKIGLAKSDEEGRLAFPYKILKNEKIQNVLKEIILIIEQEKIGKIVIGESLDLKGNKNKIWEETNDFKNILEIKSGLEIIFEKEWLSTVEARKSDNRRNADDSAAAIILQRYLDKVEKQKKLS